MCVCVCVHASMFHMFGSSAVMTHRGTQTAGAAGSTSRMASASNVWHLGRDG